MSNNNVSNQGSGIKRKELFWDIEISNIDEVFDRSSDWVIMRIVEHGALHDIRELIRYYGSNKVSSVLAREQLSPMQESMAFLYFGIDKNGKWKI